MTAHLTRQFDLIPLDALREPITIIGAGAIGSWVTLSLCKMGFSAIRVFDFDTVEVYNMNSQLFAFSDIGKPKVQALADMVKHFTGTQITALNCKYTAGSFPGIVICAVDSMACRKTIWGQHVGTSLFTRAVIDARMGAEAALLYVMRPMQPKDAESYENTLYADSQAVQEACTSKATCYTALSIAGLVCTQVKALVTGKPYARVSQWDIPTNQLVSFQASLD